MTEDETIAPEEGNKKIQPGKGAPQMPPAVSPAVQGPTSPATPPATPAQLGNDFTKILEEIKLPERRDFKAAADTQKTALIEPEAAILEEHIVKKEGDQTAPTSDQPKGAEGERSTSMVVPMRTLKDDLQTIVREQKISLVHAASLEEEKKHGQEHLEPEQQEIRARKKRRTVSMVFATSILVLLGAGALTGVYIVMRAQQSIPPAPQASILFAEQSAAFPLGGQPAQALKTSLAQARTRQLGTLGSITRVIPTVTSSSTNTSAQQVPATLTQFFSALGIVPPQELMNAIGPDFFFGFHVVDTNAPILIIPVLSYDHAFAGMLAWEPNIDPNLAPIFTPISMTVATSGVPMQRSFGDKVMRNYDVRELTDDSGNVVLYYSFPTPNILVIAQSPYSFSEILSRLQAARKL